jgi:hypothetical protein
VRVVQEEPLRYHVEGIEGHLNQPSPLERLHSVQHVKQVSKASRICAVSMTCNCISSSRRKPRRAMASLLLPTRWALFSDAARPDGASGLSQNGYAHPERQGLKAGAAAAAMFHSALLHTACAGEEAPLVRATSCWKRYAGNCKYAHNGQC